MCVIGFWFAVALLVYTNVGFPCLVYVRGKLFHRPFLSADSFPTVSLIIAAYNEQDNISRKLENVAQLDYPSDRLKIYIASDGSTDRTEDYVANCDNPQVELLRLPRQGKAAALNVAVAASNGEILVFSDANSMWEPHALRELVAPMADPNVGGVAGDQRYFKRAARSVTDQGERSYWGFDRWLKVYESRAGNVIAATGAIYAIRRSLFTGVPEGVTDDFATSTSVIAQGARLVFAPRAVAWEHVAERGAQEFARKTRVITRGLRGVLLRKELLLPWRYGFYSLQLASHKLLRRLMFVPLLILLWTSLVLATSHLGYLTAAAAQVVVYGLAMAGLGCSRLGLSRSKLFSLPAYFVMVNAACVVAVWRVVTGNRIVLWEPTHTGPAKPALAAVERIGEPHGPR